MYDEEWMTYTDGQSGKANGAVILLAALLVGVFFLVLGGYGYFAAIGEGSLAGELPGAVLVLREWVEENESVSVFLGLSPSDATEAGGSLSEEEERILAAAEAYIREKEGW